MGKLALDLWRRPLRLNPPILHQQDAASNLEGLLAAMGHIEKRETEVTPED